MLREILIVIAIILSIPAGYLIAWLCRDELVNGRRWFKSIIIISIIGVIVFLIVSNYVISLTFLFIIIVNFILLWKSFDYKFVKKRFV